MHREKLTEHKRRRYKKEFVSSFPHLYNVAFMNNEIELQEKIVKMLRTVFDPEIPVNVYDLGLIYKIDIEGTTAHIEMTLTAPNCPAADFIIDDIRMKVESVEGIETADIKLVFEPEWDKDMMSEEAKLDLGFL